MLHSFGENPFAKPVWSLGDEWDPALFCPPQLRLCFGDSPRLNLRTIPRFTPLFNDAVEFVILCANPAQIGDSTGGGRLSKGTGG